MRNMQNKCAVFVVILCIISSGCATLNSVQKAELESMKASDAGVYVEEKNVGTGTALGFILGGGSFYTRQWGLGVLDLLLWPWSILWDPVSGNEGAQVINYNMSKARSRRLQKKELRNLEDMLDAKEIDEQKFRRNRRAIEDKYTFD